MQWLGLASLCSLTSAIALTSLVRWLAVRFGIFDRPDGVRKLQPAPVPLGGGIAVFFAWVAGIAIASVHAPLSPVLLVAAGVALVTGVLDDIYSLRARWKLLGQVCSAGALVAGGMAAARCRLLGMHIELGWLGPVLALVWLVGTMNAVNMLDGMDGLAATLGLLSCLTVAGMAWLAGNMALLFGAAALAAGLAGFLPFNLPPARIYLGDSGSSVLGLLLGAYTLQAAATGAATVAVLVPVTILIVPVFDCAAAIVRRRLRGVGLAMPDRDHIHHRLLRQGWSHRQVLARLGAVAALAGIAALPSMSLGSELLALLAACSLTAAFIVGKRFGYEEVLLARDFLFHKLTYGRTSDQPKDRESVMRRSVERPETDDHRERRWRRSA